MRASYQPAQFGGHSHSGSGVIIILVCHVISQNYLIKRSSDCGSRNMMFLMIEEHYSTCPGSNPPLLFIAKSYRMSCSHTQNFRTYTQ